MADTPIAAELTTRDVLLQVDRRLTLIEVDLRTLDEKLDDKIDGLRSEMTTQNSSLRSEMNAQIGGLHSEMVTQNNSLRSEMNTRFERMNTCVDEVYTRLDAKIDSRFNQLVGILLASWVTLAGLVWFK